MNHKHLRLSLILLWSLLVRWFIWPAFRVMALVSDRVRDQIKGRRLDSKSPVELARLRRRFADCIVFFCSSAGEYEQAKPLIDRITKDENVLCHVIFFSVSGAKFIKARQDTVSWSLSPPDDASAWGAVFAALRPSKTIIVRHELWPAFLWVASQWGQVCVLNAVVPALLGRQSEWKERLNLTAKAWLLWFVDLICVVSQADFDFFERRLFVPKGQLLITGDTKYDRVIERAERSSDGLITLRHFFREHWTPQDTEALLIGGSVHVADVELLLDAMTGVEMKRIKLILVPHDVSSGNIAKIFDLTRLRGFSSELLSEIRNADFKLGAAHPRIIIVDEMGRLSDLYSVADLAWVGGAMHAKVHNVLEPAAWGVPVSCGPRFENSQEAVALHDAGLLFVPQDPDHFRQHVIETSSSLSILGQNTKSFARNMAGASDKVFRAIFKKS